jgi:D-3-phosphoglycerate dehydrogenase
MSMKSFLVVAVDDGYLSYDQEIEILRQVGANFEIRPCHGSEQAVMEAVKGADLVLVRESPITRAVIESMPQCQCVIRYGIGVDNIDFAAARDRRLMVANVPDYGIEEVSTHAVGLLLAAMRQLIVRDRNVRAGKWSSNGTRPMYRLRGRTLGLIGYGKIARQFHEKLSGFHFGKVMVFDPQAKLDDSVVPASVEEICAEADVISLHAPLTDSTRRLINRERLKLMKPNAILINTARGGLIDQAALYEALRDDQILGAGLDVFEQEPPDASHPLFSLDNVVVSDHISWYSEEAMRDLQRKAAEEAARVLSGQQPINWINRNEWE